MLKSSLYGSVFLLLSILAACGGSDGAPGGGDPAPTATSNSPVGGATGAALNGSASVTFSQEMDPASLNATTFTLTSGVPAAPVQGTVIYSGSTATFWPSVFLAGNTLYTATVTTGATNATGVALEAMHVWTFTTGVDMAPGLGVELGTAGDFVILAKSGISTVPPSNITGHIGVSPIDATAITGFSLTLDPTNAFSTSAQVTGSVYAADYAPPTPARMTAAIGDMELAFAAAAARAPDVTELGAGDIGGMTLAAGVYKWGTGLLIPTDLTLSGSATEVWIFQIGQDLTVSGATMIHLAGGALAKNVFWQVAGAVNVGTTAHLEGIVLAQTAITLETGASVNGRLLAQTAVVLDGSTIVEPNP